MMGWDIRLLKATIFNSGDQPYEATNLRQIGKAVASTLLHPLETKNKYIYIHSFTLTQNKVLAALEKALGKKWEVTRSSVKEISASGHEHLRKGNEFYGLAETVTAAVYGYGNANNFGEKALVWNKVLGLPEEDLDTTIGAIAEKKRVQT